MGPETSYNVVYGSFWCLLPSIRVIGLSLIGLSLMILSTNKDKISNILGEHLYNYGWCIVRRQTIWRKSISIEAHDISRRMIYRDTRKIHGWCIVIEAHDISWVVYSYWDPWYIETLEIEQQKLSRNSNGHNFSPGCPIQAHNILKHSKLNLEAQGKFKRP